MAGQTQTAVRVWMTLEDRTVSYRIYIYIYIYKRYKRYILNKIRYLPDGVPINSPAVEFSGVCAGAE